MKLSIVIATYQRKDGSTPRLLMRALDSIFSQTHQNFKVYLIGDRYENNSEILEIVNKYDPAKLFFENLPIAKERDNHKDKNAIWSYGGVNAMNHGIKKSLSEGYEYICHLDHDDWWTPNHLEEIKNCIMSTDASWVCTKSSYGTDRYGSARNISLPNINPQETYSKFLPKFTTLIHSSVCMNFKRIPLLYRDLFALTNNVTLPGDGDLWERCRPYIEDNKLKSYYINKLTCHHEEEGYSARN
jgi:glycosyltransferase involved in cell wall biosynthesis